MAKLGYTGTIEQYAPRDFDAIPAGKYATVVTQSEVCNAKSGGGQYVKLQWQIVEGPYSGRVIFSQHNIFNPNADAERIGRSELQGFADAVGVGELEDSEQLHGKPMLAHVSIEKDKTGRYSDRNEIKRASSYSAGSANNAPKHQPQGHHQPHSQSLVSSGRQGGVQPSGEAMADANGARRSSPASMGGMRGNPFAECHQIINRLGKP